MPPLIIHIHIVVVVLPVARSGVIRRININNVNFGLVGIKPGVEVAWKFSSASMSTSDTASLRLAVPFRSFVKPGKMGSPNLLVTTTSACRHRLEQIPISDGYSIFYPLLGTG